MDLFVCSPAIRETTDREVRIWSAWFKRQVHQNEWLYISQNQFGQSHLAVTLIFCIKLCLLFIFSNFGLQKQLSEEITMLYKLYGRIDTIIILIRKYPSQSFTNFPMPLRVLQLPNNYLANLLLLCCISSPSPGNNLTL